VAHPGLFSLFSFPNFLDGELIFVFLWGSCGLGLVKLVTEIFANKLNGRPHQKDKLRSDVTVTAQMLREVCR
jgi:hypothetical protein